MSLTVRQAILVADFFQTEDPQEEKKIKSMTNDQRDTCYRALKIVEKATAEDLKAPESDPLDNAVIGDIKIILANELPGEEPVEHAWYAKPFCYIAHLINSFAKGFANIFWRVSSRALTEKATAYRNDVTSYEQELKSYWLQTQTDAGLQISRYKDVDNRIKTATDCYNQENESAEELENFLKWFKEIRLLASLENVKKERAEQTNLPKEMLAHTSLINLEIKTLTSIVQSSLERPREEDVLKTEIFGALWNLLVEIDKENIAIRERVMNTLKSEHAAYFELNTPFQEELAEINKPLDDLKRDKDKALSDLKKFHEEEMNALSNELVILLTDADRARRQEILTLHQTKIDDKYKEKWSAIDQIELEYEALLKKKAEELKPTIDLLYKNNREIDPLATKYNEDRDIAEEEIRAELAKKAIQDDRRVAQEIEIAIRTLEAKRQPLIDKQGILATATTNLENVMGEQTQMLTKETLLKELYPKLKLIKLIADDADEEISDDAPPLLEGENPTKTEETEVDEIEEENSTKTETETIVDEIEEETESGDSD
jgi:hypothetical protein